MISIATIAEVSYRVDASREKNTCRPRESRCFSFLFCFFLSSFSFIFFFCRRHGKMPTTASTNHEPPTRLVLRIFLFFSSSSVVSLFPFFFPDFIPLFLFVFLSNQSITAAIMEKKKSPPTSKQKKKKEQEIKKKRKSRRKSKGKWIRKRLQLRRHRSPPPIKRNPSSISSSPSFKKNTRKRTHLNRIDFFLSFFLFYQKRFAADHRIKVDLQK